MWKCFKNPAHRQYAIVFIANLSVVNLGLSIVWASPMLVKFRAENQTILSTPPTENEEAWIVSINSLAGTIAFLAVGPIMNLIGRKTLYLLIYIPRLLGCFIKVFATEVWMVFLARSLTGIADQLTMVIVPTYVAEVAGKEIRGASGTLMQIMSAVGMMIMFAVGPYVSYLVINVTLICIMTVTFIPLLFIPETPYYLYFRGRTQESIEVLTLLHGTKELAHEEIKSFATSSESDSNIDKRALLKDKVVIKTFVLVIFLSMGLIFSGYNAVNFYLQTIFEATQTSLSSELSSLIIGVIQLLACLCTFLLTDRFGRKPILCSTLIGMSLGMIGLGTFFIFLDGGREITGFLNYFPLISIIIIIFGYNAGMGSLFWMLVAELFEGPMRAYGVTSSVFVSSFFNFLLALFFPGLTYSIGAPATYYTFAVICVIVCLVILYFVPETKGRTFAEIQTALGRKDLNALKPDPISDSGVKA